MKITFTTSICSEHNHHKFNPWRDDSFEALDTEELPVALSACLDNTSHCSESLLSLILKSNRNGGTLQESSAEGSKCYRQWCTHDLKWGHYNLKVVLTLSVTFFVSKNMQSFKIGNCVKEVQLIF